MTELFAPLHHLLGCGGDPRLDIDPASGLNGYGCALLPCTETLSFSSSTATSISERGYDRAGRAREALMQSAIADGIEAAFDARTEAMRRELKACFELPHDDVDVVFSPSGTDAQLQALFLTRALLGPDLTTIVVAADQTGSGTEHTARGHHFNVATANGHRVHKGEPVAGLASSASSIALGLLDQRGGLRNQDDIDALVCEAIERSVASGNRVLLQSMDSSKLGWRAPSERCLAEISTRWPGQVQIVVDACQMRLGRPRLRSYLDRGYIVVITGSKFFTGPAFSGALLVPAHLKEAIDAGAEIPQGLADYSSRSDWPSHWHHLRSRFPVRENFGQWLRWEAALEEVRHYYRVPDRFRIAALTAFSADAARIIASSPSLHLLPRQQRPAGDELVDEELAQPTILAFMIRHRGRLLSLSECRNIYRALASDALIGQPVALGRENPDPVAVLRISASARLVSEAWSTDADVARTNLERQIADVGTIVAGIERLLANLDEVDSVEACHGA